MKQYGIIYSGDVKMFYQINEDGSREPLPIRVSTVEHYVEIINRLRKKEKVTVEGIGHIIGVQKPTASKIIHGQVSLSVEKLIKILSYFGYELLICEKYIHEDYFPSLEEHYEQQENIALAEDIEKYYTGEDEEEKEEIKKNE